MSEVAPLFQSEQGKFRDRILENISEAAQRKALPSPRCAANSARCQAIFSAWVRRPRVASLIRRRSASRLAAAGELESLRREERLLMSICG